MSSGASPSFEGVSLDEVLAGGTGLYEVTTSSGVPVRMHDMQLVALVHDPLRRTLVVELRYDDPRWTPEAARLTPLAVLAFDGVEVVEHREEPAGPGATADDLGRVMGFDHDPASGVFALSAFTTYLVFTASRVVLGLRPARTPPAGPPDART